MSQQKISINNGNGQGITLPAIINFPEGFDENKKYPTIFSTHSIGSCKEQTSGNVYGQALADAGFIVLVPDASFQGESGGER